MSKILEGNPVKKAHITSEYTKETLSELELCSDPANGHMYFITNYGYIKHPSRGKIVYKPFNYQYRLLDVYHNYRFSISMCGRQMGKALAWDTPVLTVDGFKNMEDIAVGDYVYSYDGLPTKVTNKTEKQLKRDCYRILFDNGESIVADAMHLWKGVIDGREITTNTLDMFHDQDNKMIINVGDIIEFPKDYHIDPAEAGKSIGNGSPLSMLDSYLYGSLEERLKFLDGFIHNIKCDDGTYSFTSHSLDLINKLRYMLASISIVCKVTEVGFSYKLSFEYKVGEKHTQSFKVDKIEKVDSVPVYCLTVDNESHMFLVGYSLIPTHNCVVGDTSITVRNKKTNEIKEISIEEFHDMTKGA